MAAIKLLTDEYDRNIVYRQQLKSTFLGFEVSEEVNYFMTIAFPCAGGTNYYLKGPFEMVILFRKSLRL